MCGLFGYATTTSVTNLNGAALVLALENQSRGRDSWGATNGKELFKFVGQVERQWYKLPIRNKGVLLAHTRAATVGAVSKENSHPFEFTGTHHVIGAHNGSIRNWQELNKKYERKFDVDSMHIFAHIANELPLNELEGSGAIVFLKDGGLYFSRFNGGTLAIAQLKAQNGDPLGLAWSSVLYDLKKALEGSGIHHTIYDIEDGHIYYWDNNRLFNSTDKMPIKEVTYTYARGPYSTGKWNYQTQKWESDNKNENNSNIRDKRIIRIRVTKEAAKTSTPKSEPIIDVELEEIKKKIFNNKDLVGRSSQIQDCTMCKSPTTLRLLEKDPTCLTCLATMVKTGKITITETPAEA